VRLSHDLAAPDTHDRGFGVGYYIASSAVRQGLRVANTSRGCGEMQLAHCANRVLERIIGGSGVTEHSATESEGLAGLSRCELDRETKSRSNISEMNIQTTQIAVHPIIATIEAKVFPSLLGLWPARRRAQYALKALMAVFPSVVRGDPLFRE